MVGELITRSGTVIVECVSRHLIDIDLKIQVFGDYRDLRGEVEGSSEWSGIVSEGQEISVFDV